MKRNESNDTVYTSMYITLLILAILIEITRDTYMAAKMLENLTISACNDRTVNILVKWKIHKIIT